MGSEQKNALFAVVLSGLILFAWQTYFVKTPAPIEPSGQASLNQNGTEVESRTQLNQSTTSLQNEETGGPIEPVQEVAEYEIKDHGVLVKFNSFLMIKDFENAQSAFSFLDVVESQESFGVEFDFGAGFSKLSFNDLGQNEGMRILENQRENLQVRLKILENGVLQFKANSSRPFKYRFTYKTPQKKLENGQIRQFSYFTDELNLITVGDDEAGDKAIKWAGIDFNYHLFATYFMDKKDLLFSAHSDGNFALYSNKSTNDLDFNLVFVKKEYNYLTSLGHNLNNSVDFGVWGFFAVWILRGLQFFYSFIPNYGLSIILLTFIVRMITFPLQYKSFVSMKKLQLIQPELTKIREKFKDDPMRVQKESMELFKRSGANPLGGCLPLLLQMPVFFAFYKVLHSAVELVDAPFILWIHDLSNKDPFYILPVLMTLSMFLQQKMTPNTVSDPTQKKMMMFMPLIFGFFMKDLPSGLSLYIFVSTLFGIVQQVVVFNSQSKPNIAVVA